MRPLYRLREDAMFSLGQIASEHHVTFERKWLAEPRPGSKLLGSADVSSVSDIARIASSPYSLTDTSGHLPMAFQLALTAGLPMLAVVAMQMPLEQFLGYVLSTLL